MGLFLESKDNTAKIYVLLTNQKTWFSKLVSKVNKAPYSHAMLSFDKSLFTAYGFTTNGFTYENIRQDYNPEGTFSLYSIEVPIDIYEKARQFIADMEANKDRYKYNRKGLLGFILKKPIASNEAFFCSEFVATVFNYVGLNLFDKPAALMSPYDIIRSGKFRFEFRGKIKNYHKIYLKHNKINEDTDQTNIVSEPDLDIDFNYHKIATVIKDSSKERILMLRRVNSGRDTWEIPEFLSEDPDDDLRECLRDEIQRDINIEILKFRRLIGAQTTKLQNVTIPLQILSAVEWIGPVKILNPEKYVEYRWMTIEEIEKLNDISHATQIVLENRLIRNEKHIF